MLTGVKGKQFESKPPKNQLAFPQQIDAIRQRAILSLDPLRRNSLGQYFTPLPIAQMMASMFQTNRKTIHLLDAGAGAGVLSTAFVDAVCKRKQKPTEITVTVYELDENLLPFLSRTLDCCRELCVTNDIEFSAIVKNEDFILAATDELSPGLFAAENKSKYDLAILNPPYGKINTDSEISRALRRCGIVTPNLYTAFVALAADLLDSDGEMVAITPRSFCNGTYFKSFRRYFTERMSFRRFHVFDSRQGNFDEDILQENIIFHAVKDGSNQPEPSKRREVFISTGLSTEKVVKSQFKLTSDVLIKPDDEEMYIHLSTDELNQDAEKQMRHFRCSLGDLGLAVSTGKVVDFRVKDFLRNGTERVSAPLIYPHNFQNGIVDYPLSHPKKFDSIRINPVTESLLIKSGDYVLVKRFSAKEEKRRVTAAIFTSAAVKCDVIGFENHLNYFHSNGKSLEPDLARGLAIYLNSSLVDAYFRQFSGHTQVNAGDLRYLKYPTITELKKLGKHFNGHLPSQETIDTLIRQLTTNE
jgi:adenine-specific DNA-methyltransferase